MEADGSPRDGARSRNGRKKGKRSRGGGSATEPRDAAGGGAVKERPRDGEQSNAEGVGGRNGKEGDAVQATPPRDGEQVPGPGEGRLRRRRARRNRKKSKGDTAGEGSAAGPHGSRDDDAEGDTAGGHAVKAAPPRAGEQSGGGGGRGGLNGATGQERVDLGGLAGPSVGRNGGVGEERPGLGRVQPPQRGALAGGHGGAAAGSSRGTLGAEDGDAVAGGDSNAGVLDDEQVGHGDQQATGSSPVGAGGKDAVFPRDEAAAEEDGHNGDGLGGATVTNGEPEPGTGAADSEQRATASTLLSQTADDIKDGLNTDMHKGKKEEEKAKGKMTMVATAPSSTPLTLLSPGLDIKQEQNADTYKDKATGSPHSGAAGTDGGSVQPVGEGEGGGDKDQTDVGCGGDPGGEEKVLLPRRTFLSDALLSWTMNDVLNDYFYKQKVQRIPDKFETVQHFAEVHCQLLLEELRSELCSSLKNPSAAQYCKLLSVQQCGSPCVYFLDIDLDATNPNDPRCRHIAHDYDVCLLTSKPLGDSNLDIMTSSIGIAVGIGKSTYFQRSFRVVLLESKDFQPENIKYVSFLINVQHKMKISDALSLDDEGSHAAIQRVMELHQQVGKQCKICAASPNGKYILHSESSKSLFSSMQCPHQEHVEIVWAPMGSSKGFIAREMNEFLSSKQKLLICLPSALGIPDTLMDLKEYSDNIVVLNNSKDLENYTVCNEVFLESRSHKLYCFVTQYQGALKAMTSLLNLNNFYHYKRCASPLCERCSKKGLLDFTMKSVVMRFNNLIDYLLDCLTFLDKHGTAFSLPEEDSTKVIELSKTLEELETLLNKENLKDERVAMAFGLVPGVDASSLDSTNTLAELLNKMRISSINLMGSLISSVQVSNMRNSDDLDRFCIKHSNIIVTPIDCNLELNNVEQFDILVILGTNQIKEVDLLVPFLHPVKHTIMVGDPHHLQPAVQSESCKEAGYGISIFDKMQKLVPNKVLMLKQQFTMHPMMSKFPNNHFYNGVIEDGPNVMIPEYNKEFSEQLPKYCYTDIPSGKTRPTRKLYINSAAIFLYLQSFCKDTTHSNRKFSVAVVCISSDEANEIRELLRFKKEIHAKVHLHVKSVDSFEEDSFDLIILSMLVEDKAELSRVKGNNLYAVLTSSRHYFWMVGECDTLSDAGGIWKRLVEDATERECWKPMKFDKLSESANSFEKIDKDRCIYSVLSNIFADLLGQELTWEGRPYKTKYMLPFVRNQKGQPDTCSFHSISAAVEALLKFLFADMVPQQEFKWTFIVDDFKKKYEIIIGKDFQSENASDRGNKRFENALTAFKDLGVMAKNESGNELQEVKTSFHEYVDPNMTKNVTKLLEAGSIMVGHFLLSRNFYSLKPGEVYVHDKDMQLFHSKSGLPASHAVMMVGIGRRRTELVKTTGKPKYTRHMVMQNSESELFGISGIGRVGKKSVLDLYRITVSEVEAKKLAHRGT